MIADTALVPSGVVPAYSPPLAVASAPASSSGGPSSVVLPAKAVPAPPVDNSHVMRTRGKFGF
jgi:hypothetical protein